MLQSFLRLHVFDYNFNSFYRYNQQALEASSSSDNFALIAHNNTIINIHLSHNLDYSNVAWRICQDLLRVWNWYVQFSLTLQCAVLTSPPRSPPQVFNRAAFQAKSARELMDAVANFMDCSIVIPPTEIQNEAMLTSIISFQKKLLQDRLQASNPPLCLDSKPRRGEHY